MAAPYATFDEVLLAVLAGEGSLQRTEFASLALSIDGPGPVNEDQLLGWLADAQARALVRVDPEDDLVTITQEGQNQLIELLQDAGDKSSI
jgi:hypothetical protein